jgi:PAS domain S-box-containing protein
MADTPTKSAQALRQRAEERFRANESDPTETLSPEDAKELLHDLRVHQIELEIQNEELRRVQNELECSRARYFDLYDLAPVGYLTLSEQGLIQEANLAIATMLGMTRGSLLKRPISKIIQKEDQNTYYLHRKQLLGSGEQQAWELRLVRRDGTIFWAHLAATVDKDLSGASGQDPDSTPTVRIVVSEISERKQAEEALLETNSRLLEATATAHEMAAKSEAASQVKSQFLANMSHELRTPMTGVLGMLDLLLLGNLDAEQQDFISKAHTSASSLVRILNDILDLTKIEMGKFSIEEKPFSLRECAKDVLGMLLPLASSKGLALNLAVADDVPEVLSGDPTRLNQVLTNLAGNAVKFTEKGEVDIRVSAGGSAPSGKRDFTITVTDTGIGIPDGKRDLLFHNFSQVDETHSRSYGGTGLGLVISKEIVERMGGTISFTSAVGKGSNFTCTIPLNLAKPEHSVIKTPEKTALSRVPRRANETRRPRILLAEDDPVIRQIFGKMLEKADYDVDFAENGQRAVDMWGRGGYDLILMDVQMPLLNGFDASTVIREKEQNRTGHIPIVAVTAHALVEDQKRCQDAGMDAYISKPINFTACLQLIEETLKKHGRDSNANTGPKAASN